MEVPEAQFWLNTEGLPSMFFFLTICIVALLEFDATNRPRSVPASQSKAVGHVDFCSLVWGPGGHFHAELDDSGSNLGCLRRTTARIPDPGCPSGGESLPIRRKEIPPDPDPAVEKSRWRALLSDKRNLESGVTSSRNDP